MKFEPDPVKQKVSLYIPLGAVSRMTQTEQLSHKNLCCIHTISIFSWQTADEPVLGTEKKKKKKSY